MSNAKSIVTRRRFVASIGGTVTSAALWPLFGAAHEVMMTYVEHAVRVVVGPINVDITVELTFNELVSLKERMLMDRDRDGRISDSELAAYLEKLAPTLVRGTEVMINGISADVLELYDPKLDLLGTQMVEPAHHLLKLAFFARIPDASVGRKEIVVRDHLWADAPALCIFQAEGAGGLHVEVTSPRKLLSNKRDAGEGNRMVRIVIAGNPPSESYQSISH